MSEPERPEEPSGELSPPRRIPLRPGESSGNLRPAEPSGSLPPPLRIQPITRPGSVPLNPGASAHQSPGRVELQQLEMKNPSGPDLGVPIPARPNLPKAPVQQPPEDLSGVVPRGWPPPRVPLGDEPAPPSELAPRALPAPEVSASSLSRPRIHESRSGEHPRVPLGPPPDLEVDAPRGGVAPDARASWGESDTVPISTAKIAARIKKPASRGPIILVTAFAAVLLGLLIVPSLQKKSDPAAVASASPTPSPESEPPIAVVTPAGPKGSPTPKSTPRFTPTPEFTPPPPVLPKLTPTPTPSLAPEPPPVPPSPSPTPAATVAIKPPPLVPTPAPEPPPARVPVAKTYSVKVYLTPAGVDSKVYLVDRKDRNHRYSDEGRGNVQLVTRQKGSYTLKVMAPGYETFSKDIEVEGDRNLAVRLEKIPPPPEPTYAPPSGPAPYVPPAYNPPPAYVPPRPAPAPYQIPAPGI